MRRIAAVAAVAMLVAGCSEPTTAPPSLSPSAPLFDVGNPPPPKVNGVTTYVDVAGAGAIIGAGINSAGVAGAPVITGAPVAGCPGFIFCVPSDYNQNEPPVTFKVLTFNEPRKLPGDIRRQLARGGAICGFGEGLIMCSARVTRRPRIVVNGSTSRGEGVAFDMSSDGSMVTTIVLRQFDGYGPTALTCVGETGVITVETPTAVGQKWVRVTTPPPGNGDEDEDRADDDRGDNDNGNDGGQGARYRMLGPTYSPFTFRSDIAANASCKTAPPIPGGGQ